MTKKRELPKYCYPMPNRHGTPRHYFWRGPGHAKIRVDAELLSADFFTAYAAFLGGEALNKQSGPQSRKPRVLDDRVRSLRWLCDKYLGSDEFKGGLSPKTQQVRRNILIKMREAPHPRANCEVWGNIPIEKLTMAHVKHIRDSKLVWKRSTILKRMTVTKFGFARIRKAQTVG